MLPEKGRVDFNLIPVSLGLEFRKQVHLYIQKEEFFFKKEKKKEKLKNNSINRSPKKKNKMNILKLLKIMPY